VLSTKTQNPAELPQAKTADLRALRRYRPELDVVRLLAFFLVFLHHTLPRSEVAPKVDRLFQLVGPRGWPAVVSFTDACGMGLCLFFALSAYLITELLLAERKTNKIVSVRKFYIRRALRIWPLYIFGIAVGITLALLHHDSQSVTGFLWFLLIAGNIYCATFGWIASAMNPLWSISIEEQFYLVWPWAMRYLSRRGLALCTMVFLVAANGALSFLSHRNMDIDTPIWANTFVQFEMFATGILLALAHVDRELTTRPALGSAVALTGPLLWFLACFAFHIRHPDSRLAGSGISLMIGYGLVAIGCAAVLQGFSMIGPDPMPRWATDLGKISYGLYVYHLLAGEMVTAVLQRLVSAHSFTIGFPATLLLTVLLAKLSYRWIESPFLRLKMRFEIVHGRPI
jgi:peptidoglycan/LPS O-acetylase OafA/YrhL